ncbi:MAG: Lrp/AsnC family transcriptional regulator [Candidatus Helarchaeota archaeon]
MVGDIRKSKKMDIIDIELIDILKEDSRSTYRTIADQLNISESTARNRIKKLINNKIIEKFTLKLDLEKIGFAIGWILRVNIDSYQINSIIDNLFYLDNIVAIYEVSGEENLIIFGYSKNISELRMFLKNIIYTFEGILGLRIEIMLNEVK